MSLVRSRSAQCLEQRLLLLKSIKQPVLVCAKVSPLLRAQFRYVDVLSPLGRVCQCSRLCGRFSTPTLSLSGNSFALHASCVQYSDALASQYAAAMDAVVKFAQSLQQDFQGRTVAEIEFAGIYAAMDAFVQFPELQEAAFMGLWKAASWNEVNCDRIGRVDGGLARIYAAMDTHASNFAVQTRGAMLLSMLAQQSPTALDSMRASNALSRLERAKANNDGNKGRVPRWRKQEWSVSYHYGLPSAMKALRQSPGGVDGGGASSGGSCAVM